MNYAETWLDEVLSVGGDTEPPTSPKIPEDYLPKLRKKCESSLQSNKSPSNPSPAKRKRAALAEICSPNKDIKMTSRPRSPRKKANTKSQAEDENLFVAEDPDATPKAARSSNRPLIQESGKAAFPLRPEAKTSSGNPNSPDEHSSSVGESTDSKGSRRSRSPTKRLADLSAAQRKVNISQILSPSDVPDDVRSLLREVETLGCKIGVIPMELKESVETECKDKEAIFPFNFASQSTGKDQQQLEEEFKELLAVRRQTAFCERKQLHEPSWNERVHCRILQQAVKDLSGVEYYNITTARVVPELVPKNKYGEMLKNKMIDYAITLGEPLIAEDDVIARLASSDKRFCRTIGPSDYSPLCYEPIAISIETKSREGSKGEAMVQLSVWTTAQFNRLRDLLPAAVAQEPISITLPLLFVLGDEWSLLFARERDTSLEILGTSFIINTKSIVGCYAVLAIVRRLCEWATTTFKDWFTKNILTVE